MNSPARLGSAFAVLAAVLVLATLDHPGITVDEPLDVQPGRKYVAALRSQGWAFFEPRVVERVFRDNAEHPPLGRWLLGVASTLFEPLEIAWRGVDPVGIYTRAGRVAPALCYAGLVGLITATTAAWFGPIASLAAGFSLLAMPRVFAHAHFGALDTFITTFWIAAWFGAERALRAKRPALAMLLAGAVWGLALLTKIHAWLIPPLVLGLAFFRRGSLGTIGMIRALFAWTLIGLIVFLAGWPWLWYGGWNRFRDYLSTGWHRSPIMVEYFGQVLPDHSVPWHYPWFYFLVTVPVGLHLLGTIGVVAAFRAGSASDRGRLVVLIAPALMLLSLFSLSAPVYDGERLFLMVFPLWSAVIGHGFSFVWNRSRGTIRLAWLMLLLGQAYGVVIMHPFQLSYYNAVVGGLAGAERLGLELTYWNDAVDDLLLDDLAKRVAVGQTAALVPTLHPDQGKINTSAALLGKGCVLGDDPAAASADWLVVSRRTAYWKPQLRDRIQRHPPLSTRQRQGVWLSGIWAPLPQAFH